MLNWKRMIVGDAFKLSSGGINHYRDLFLTWPFLLFSIVAILNLFASDSAHRSYGIKLAVCAFVAILLAKERLILFVVALGYVAIRLAVAVIFIHDWRVLLGLLLSSGILLAILRSRVGVSWKPSYAITKGLNSLDLVVGVSGLGAAIALAMWMKP
jgi:hypothetical protein